MVHSTRVHHYNDASKRTHHHTHNHHGHENHGGHDQHAGHNPKIFKRRFFICLVLTLPILYFSPQFQSWLRYQAIIFPGSNWINPIFGIPIYLYGGWVFLKGAWSELRSQIGMMTLIALAITVAFVYSLAVSLGLQGKPFYWELATLLDIMLLGHWVEAAERKKLDIPNMSDFETVTGKGVQGNVNGKTYRIGRPEWVSEQQIHLPVVLKRAFDRADERGESAVVLMDDQQAVAVISMADQVRQQAKETVHQLRQIGYSDGHDYR